MRHPRHQPADAALAPRYTGVRTFARLPHTRKLSGVDLAVLGVPFDTATSFRPGARFGPEAVRAGSQLLRPWHPVHGIDVFASRSSIDYGDVAVTPGNAARTTEQICDELGLVLDHGVVPIVVGGDHSVVLGELRAYAARYGPVAVVLLDARVGDAPALLSFDIDVLDPAYAPGTGTPEIAGLTPARAVALLGSLRGMRWAGFDLVEVAPAYDTAGATTAIHASGVLFELLALAALAPLDERPVREGVLRRACLADVADAADADAAELRGRAVSGELRVIERDGEVVGSIVLTDEDDHLRVAQIDAADDELHQRLVAYAEAEAARRGHRAAHVE